MLFVLSYLLISLIPQWYFYSASRVFFDLYKENCFSIDCDQCSISLKLFLPFCFQTMAVLGNKHILFALAWFHIAHKYTKMCPLTHRLLLRFRFRYPQHLEHVLAQNDKVAETWVLSIMPKIPEISVGI